jgi:hypothetical protein
MQMPETITDTLGEEEGGYGVEVTDDNEIHVYSEKEPEGVTLTAEQAETAIGNKEVEETVPLGDGLGVHNDDYKDDWVGIGYEDMHETENFLGMTVLENHVASVPTSALEEAIDAIEAAAEA